MKKVLAMLLLILGISLTQLSFVSSVKAAGQVSLVSHTGYIDILGHYNVVGEVENTGDVYVRFISITVNFYNSTDHLIAVEESYAYITFLLIGRKSPFSIRLADPVRAAQVHHYTIVQPFEFDEYPEGLPLGLEIVSESSYIEPSGAMHVIGEIRNNGDQTATGVWVFVTYYNSTGNVVAVSLDSASPNNIDSGQTATFDFYLEIARVPYVASYALTAESDEYAIIPEYSSLISVALLIGTLAVIISIRNKKSLTHRNDH